MNKNVRTKLFISLAVFIIFAAVGVYPIVAQQSGLNSPQALMAKQLKLGLDLKGGVHLVLRVETEDAIRIETQTEMERLRESLRAANINVGNLTQPSSAQFRVEAVPADQ